MALIMSSLSCANLSNPASCVAALSSSTVTSSSSAPSLPSSSSSSTCPVVVFVAPHGAREVTARTSSSSCSLPCKQQVILKPTLSIDSRPFLAGQVQLEVLVPRRLVSTAEVSGARCFSTTTVPDEGVAGVPGMASFVEAALVVMKREYGAFGGATLEKSKLELSSSQTKVSPQLEDGGGSGGIGNKNNNGGGDGGDDDGDDDDYFGEDDGGDDGDDGGFFGKRVLIPEVFDRKIVEAVLQEWYMTMSNLPAGIRQAVEMGLISTAQVLRYISTNARPTVSRAIARSLPSNVSRAFIGRLLADPSFVYKALLEQATTIGLGVWWEVHNRGSRLKDEWGLAAANILTMSACNAAAVWCLSPSRSYGQTFQFEWQNVLQKLPNHSFDMSYPLRQFSMQQRVATFFYKALELGAVGVAAGTVGAGLARILPHPEETSVPMPSVSTSALSYGALLGLSGNLRYQFLYGAERLMQQNLNNMGLVIFCSTAMRILNIQVGDISRLSWLGLDETVFEMQAEGLTKAYHRPSLARDSVARWVIPKRGVISGFFEEMFNQTKEPRESQSSNIFAKRKVKRKVTVGR